MGDLEVNVVNIKTWCSDEATSYERGGLRLGSKYWIAYWIETGKRLINLTINPIKSMDCDHLHRISWQPCLFTSLCLLQPPKYSENMSESASVANCMASFADSSYFSRYGLKYKSSVTSRPQVVDVSMISFSTKNAATDCCQPNFYTP